MELTRELVCFLCGLDYRDLPPEVVERTKFLLLDYLGVAVRGSCSESSQPVYRLVERAGVPGASTVIGRRARTLPGWAALANGTAAHSLELDDTHQAGSIHLGVVIFPAAIAACEARGQVDGRSFITAAAAGYEMAARLAMALQPKAHYRRGFHPTATCGVFGAAVTVALLLGLDPQQALSAVGIAGSMAAGSLEFLAEGAWTKRLHAGLAAQNGWQAAALAAEGFRGPATILEGRDGFLRAYSDSPLPERITSGLGRSFEILRTSVKPHACCRYKQAPIDGILGLVREHQIQPDQVRQVEIAVLEAGFPLVCEPAERKYHPCSIVDAQFSMPFGAAVALLDGRASLEQYSVEKLGSQAVQDLMTKISLVKDPALEEDFPAEWPARVVIELQDGRRYENFVRHPKGDPDNPLSWDEMDDKFRSLAGVVFAESRLEEVRRHAGALEQNPDTSSLWRLLGC